jgi:hypothetical protein
MRRELHILDKKGQYNGRSGDPNKSLITKVAWRLLFKKIKLTDEAWMHGRCLECDARGDNNYSVSCCVFYCPCDFHQHLKFK